MARVYRLSGVGDGETDDAEELRQYEQNVIPIRAPANPKPRGLSLGGFSLTTIALAGLASYALWVNRSRVRSLVHRMTG